MKLEETMHRARGDDLIISTVFCSRRRIIKHPDISCYSIDPTRGAEVCLYTVVADSRPLLPLISSLPKTHFHGFLYYNIACSLDVRTINKSGRLHK